MLIWRIRKLPVSATRANNPSEEMATPSGLLKLEFVPNPFAVPDDPETPANVVREAVVTFRYRIRSLFVSATNANNPSGEMSTPSGRFNPLANVVTSAVVMIIWRIASL
jgi:hypothetical protein